MDAKAKKLDPKSMTLEQFLEFADQFKNWGKWGAEDEVGALNFVTPQRIVEACRLVKKGKVFALGIPLDENGPQRPGPLSQRFNPIHTMTMSGVDGLEPGKPFPIIKGCDDLITMPLQGATQWDALAHIIFRGKLYNGYPNHMVDGRGARKNGIDKMKDRGVGRGVLLDIPRHRGVPWLEPGAIIHGDELEACSRKQGVTVKEGDFLLVRTGNMAMCRARRDWGDYSGGPRPGLGVTTIPWLYEHRVSALACDNWGVEVLPGEIPAVPRAAVHATCLVNIGMLFGEIWDLDALAEDCAQDRVYEFLLVAPPLPVTGGVGTPINPYAIK